MAITTGHIAGARDLRVNANRLAARIDALGAVDAIPGGGVNRLALTGEDRDGRDRVAGWMRELGLVVTIVGLVPTAAAVASALQRFDSIRRYALPMKDSPAGRAMSVGFTLVKTFENIRADARPPATVQT